MKYWALRPGTIFLNHGSFGACPREVLELQAGFRQQMEAEPVQFLWRRYDDLLDRSRGQLGQFLHCRTRDLVLVTNATTGVNAVVRSLRLKPGDELLTTNQDYNACHNVVIAAAAAAGAKVVVAEVPFPLSSPSEVTEAVLQKVTRRTRLAVIDHVTSSTALIFPIAAIIRGLEQRGVDTLVDGAHAPGMLPLDLERLRPAYYAGNLHKWVCAPKGAAFLWVREDRQVDLQPAVISHGNNTHRPGHTEFQDRFDWPGTFDPAAWFCAGEASDWVARLYPGGWPAVQEANHDLAVNARRLLCGELGLEAPCPESMLGAMATLPLPERFQRRKRQGKIDPEQLRLYDEFGIEVPLFRFGKPERRYFRISAQLYNSLADYEALARAITTL